MLEMKCDKCKEKFMPDESFVLIKSQYVDLSKGNIDEVNTYHLHTGCWEGLNLEE